MIRLSSQVLWVIACIFCFQIMTTHCTQGHIASKTDYVLGIIVGRVNTEIGIFKVDGKKLSLLNELTVETATITDFTSFVKQVLRDIEQNQGITITKACIGAPGPSSKNHDSMQPYFLPLVLSAHELKQHTALKHVKIINDFEVIGFGLEYLNETSIVPLHVGKKRKHAPSTVVGVGSGVGSSLVLFEGTLQSYPLGYCYADFTPQNEEELAVVNFIKQSVNAQHMSWGYALGGTAGIRKIYDYFALQMSQNGKVMSTAQDIFNNRLVDPVAQQAVDLFLRWYARLLRTAALTQLPYNGLYITNTIAEQNPALFMSADFLSEYFDCKHAILQDVLQEIPVFLITEPKVKLYGAAACALQAAH